MGDGIITEPPPSHPAAEQWDEEAFAVLTRQYRAHVLQVCLRITGNRADAEDALQATFLALAQQLRAGRRIEVMPSWLARLARNLATHFRDGAAARRRHERQAGRQRELQTQDGPAETGDCAEQLSRLEQELALVPVRYRVALQLHYLEGESLESIAQRMRSTPGTVASWLSRGRAHLRKRMAMSESALGGLLIVASLRTASAPAALRVGRLRRRRRLFWQASAVMLVISLCSIWWLWPHRLAPSGQSLTTAGEVPAPAGQVPPAAFPVRYELSRSVVGFYGASLPAEASAAVAGGAAAMPGRSARDRFPAQRDPASHGGHQRQRSWQPARCHA